MSFKCPYPHCSFVSDSGVFFELHIRYCRVNNCCIIVKCPKNPTHFIPVMELSHHLSDRCLDSGLDDFCTKLRTAVKIKEKSALTAAAETVTTTKMKTSTRFGGINTTALNAIIS